MDGKGTKRRGNSLGLLKNVRSSEAKKFKSEEKQTFDLVDAKRKSLNSNFLSASTNESFGNLSHKKNNEIVGKSKYKGRSNYSENYDETIWETKTDSNELIFPVLVPVPFKVEAKAKRLKTHVKNTFLTQEERTHNYGFQLEADADVSDCD